MRTDPAVPTLERSFGIGDLATRPVPQRVLVVHNRYQIGGGEDAVVDREVAALARVGLAVDTLFLSNDDIQSPWDKIRTAIEAPRSARGIRRVLDKIEDFRPELVHVHNTFPLISPGVYEAISALGVATVQSLHNFRVTCAGALLMRNDAPCEDCVAGSPYQAVLHGCYRGSRVGSLAVARMIDVHRRRKTWSTHVDQFIALTAFARSRFIAAGLPAERISVKPNGMADPGLDRTQPRSGFLYVGRLSPEKGLRALASAAAWVRAPVDVIGDGPLADELSSASGLALRGRQDRNEVNAAMARASAVLVPSICYENMPMVIAEAFAAGTPVIASKIGSLTGLIQDGVTGLHVRPNDPEDLARTCNWLADHPQEAARMGRAARTVFERDWSEEVTTGLLLSIYAEAIASRAKGGHHGP